jgi:hypothetical protein
MAANYAELAGFDRAALPDIKVQPRTTNDTLEAGFTIKI